MTPVQKKIQAYKAQGMTAADIATKLNGAGTKTPTGKKWTAKLVHATTANMRASGRVTGQATSRQAQAAGVESASSEFAAELESYRQNPSSQRRAQLMELVSEIVDNPTINSERKLDYIALLVHPGLQFSGSTSV